MVSDEQHINYYWETHGSLLTADTIAEKRCFKYMGKPHWLPVNPLKAADTNETITCKSNFSQFGQEYLSLGPTGTWAS